MKTIVDTDMTVPLRCQTGTVVCMAPGPSLTAEDAAYCRDKATVVVVNDAWRFAPWADVLYSSDLRWFPFHQWVPEFSGIKVAMDLQHPGVVTLRNTGDKGLEVQPHALRTAKNSGGAAINLAVHLGAKRILLLGYDMSPTNGKAHFFGSHPSGLRNSKEQNYFLFRQLIASMVAPLHALGITVVNCSRQTALTCFPRKPLREAL